MTVIKSSQRKNNQPTKNPEYYALKAILDGFIIPVKPTIHINGYLHPTAIVTVDFGTPLEEYTLSSEQITMMGEQIISLAQNITNKQKIRFNADLDNGVYWASM